MLKRTLTIGIVLVLGLLLTAAGPPINDGPIDRLPDDWGDSTAVPDGRVDVDIEEGVAVSFIWGTATGSQTLPEAALGDSPPGWVNQIHAGLPQEIADQLPDAFGDGLAMSNDYECDLTLNPPNRSGSNVRSYAYWRCTGSAVHKTRLRLVLYRGTTQIGVSDGGWLRVKRQSRSVAGTCASGTVLGLARGVRLVNM